MDITRQKKFGILLFWMFFTAFWIVDFTIQIRQGLDYGHGIGIGDGHLHPGGQRLMPNGQLSGIEGVEFKVAREHAEKGK
jgi:hypothetical protein